MPFTYPIPIPADPGVGGGAAYTLVPGATGASVGVAYLPNDGLHAVSWGGAYGHSGGVNAPTWLVWRLENAYTGAEIAGTRVTTQVGAAPPSPVRAGAQWTIPSGLAPGYYYSRWYIFTASSTGGGAIVLDGASKNYAARVGDDFQVSLPPAQNASINLALVGSRDVFNLSGSDHVDWTYRIDYAEQAPARRRVRILDPDGVPVPGATTEWSMSPDDDPSPYISTTESFYIAAGLRPGVYTVEACYWAAQMCTDEVCSLPANNGAYTERATTTFVVHDPSVLDVGVWHVDADTDETLGPIAADEPLARGSAAPYSIRAAWAVGGTGTLAVGVYGPFGELRSVEQRVWSAGMTSDTLDIDIGPSMAPGVYSVTAYFRSDLGELQVVTAKFTVGPCDAETLLFDDLNLNDDSAALTTEAFSCPPPPKRPEWASGGDSDGAILERDPLFDNRELTLTLRVSAADMDDALGAIRALTSKIEACERTEGGLPLVWSPARSSKAMRFWVLSGAIEDVPISVDSGWFVNCPQITVKLTAKPFGYGAPVTYGPFQQAAYEAMAEAILRDVPGDVPAEALITVRDAPASGAGVDRRTVEWGMDMLDAQDDDPPSLVIAPGDFFTGPLSLATGVIADATSPTGSRIVVPLSATSAVTAPMQMCEIAGRTESGPMRVQAIVANEAFDNFSVRLVWRDSDNPPRCTPWGTVKSSNYVDRQANVVELGTINPAGNWSGWIEYKGLGSSILFSGGVGLCALVLIPVGAGYGRASAPDQPRTPTTRAASALANPDIERALNGWETWSGDANWRLAATPNAFAYRSAANDSYVEIYHGLTDVGAVDVSCDVMVTNAADYAGVVGRSRAGKTSVRAYLRIADVVAGDQAAPTLYLDGVTSGTLSARLPAGSVQRAVWYTIRLIIYPSGHVVAYLFSGATQIARITSDSAALALAGSFWNGKPGLVSISGAAGARYWRNFIVADPAHEVLALGARRRLEISSTGVQTETSEGSLAAPASYRGARPFLPPAGDDGGAHGLARAQMVRLVVKAARSDIALNRDYSSPNDLLTVDVAVTPRYIVVPE